MVRTGLRSILVLTYTTFSSTKAHELHQYLSIFFLRLVRWASAPLLMAFVCLFYSYHYLLCHTYVLRMTT